jgi:hypothetical protein
MQYKTITLQLLEQRTELANSLRRRKQLLATMESLALALKTRHEAWKQRLLLTQPGSSESQRNSASLEFALRELEERLPPALPPDDSTGFNLEEAMAFLLAPLPPA